jgi:hypothetical protein
MLRINSDSPQILFCISAVVELKISNAKKKKKRSTKQLSINKYGPVEGNRKWDQ